MNKKKGAANIFPKSLIAPTFVTTGISEATIQIIAIPRQISKEVKRSIIKFIIELFK
jgi:hypothetical protein